MMKFRFGEHSAAQKQHILFRRTEEVTSGLSGRDVPLACHLSLITRHWRFRVAEISSRQRFDPMEQIFLARHPGDLIAELPVLEK